MLTSKCFNCGNPEHSLKECPKPRNQSVINANRRQFNESKASGSQIETRYYEMSEHSFVPGVLSPKLKHALGMQDGDRVPYFDRMLKWGFPSYYETEPKLQIDANKKEQTKFMTTTSLNYTPSTMIYPQYYYDSYYAYNPYQPAVNTVYSPLPYQTYSIPYQMYNPSFIYMPQPNAEHNGHQLNSPSPQSSTEIDMELEEGELQQY